MTVRSLKKKLEQVEARLQPKEPLSIAVTRYDDLDGTGYIDYVIENFGTPEQYKRQPTPEELERHGSKENPKRKKDNEL